MKYFATAVLVVGLISSTLAQYGIPDDDDDHLPPAPAGVETAREIIPSVPSSQASPVATSYTKYEDEAPYVMQQGYVPFDIRSRDSVSEFTLPSVAQPQPEIIQNRELPSTAEYNPSPTVFTITTTDSNVNNEQNMYVRSFETPENLPSSSPVSSTQIRFSSDFSKRHASYYDAGAPAIMNEVPVAANEAVPIIKYIMDSDNRGTYRLETLSGDGTSKTVNGQLKQVNGNQVVVKSGSYSYNGDDGKVYRVDWKADEGGFQAFGDHLPK